jgi:hypothetical protein
MTTLPRGLRVLRELPVRGEAALAAVVGVDEVQVLLASERLGRLVAELGAQRRGGPAGGQVAVVDVDEDRAGRQDRLVELELAPPRLGSGALVHPAQVDDDDWAFGMLDAFGDALEGRGVGVDGDGPILGGGVRDQREEEALRAQPVGQQRAGGVVGVEQPAVEGRHEDGGERGGQASVSHLADAGGTRGHGHSI